MKIFSGISSTNYFFGKREELISYILNLDSNSFVDENPKLVHDILEKYKLDLLYINEKDISQETEEIKIDVSNDPSRYISDRSRSFYVKGIAIKFFVLFTGDKDLFYVEPNHHKMSYPEVKVDNNMLILSYKYPIDTQKNINEVFERELEDIKFNITSLNEEIKSYNDSLEDFVKAQLETRRLQLEKTNILIKSIKYPLKKKTESDYKAIVPIKNKNFNKKIKELKSKINTEEYAVLSEDIYIDILDSIKNMANVMEKSPYAFSKMDEENLRFQFLVPLNAMFEGCASGETFNFKGKTDILLGYEGKNIFIAECKFWNGESNFLKTFDQLLSYTSWRDTKTAIILFNRNKNLTKVLDQVPISASKHKNYVETLLKEEDTDFRFKFHHEDDSERLLDVSVLVFEVPLL